MAVPAQPMPPATKAMHQQESPTTSPRVYTPNATPEATPPPPMRVGPTRPNNNYDRTSGKAYTLYQTTRDTI